MTDKQGIPRGMMGDILDIIELQTGMKFVPVLPPNTLSEDRLPPEGKWDILLGEVRSKKLNIR